MPRWRSRRLVEALNMAARRRKARRRSTRAAAIEQRPAKRLCARHDRTFPRRRPPRRRVRAGRQRRRRYRDDGADHAARPAVRRPDLGRRRRRASRPLRARQRLCRAQSAARCSADPARLKLYHFARFDLAAIRYYLGVDGGAGLLHQDRLAADPHLHRSPRPQGAGPRAARPGDLQAAAIVRLGRARTVATRRRIMPPPTCASSTR